MIRHLVCGLLLASCVGARPRLAITKAVPDRFQALTLDKQKLTGLLGSRVRANSEGFLETIDMQSLIAPLSSQSDSDGPVAREYAGLFLDAAADSYEYNPDVQLGSRGKCANGVVSGRRSERPGADDHRRHASRGESRSGGLAGVPPRN